MAAQDAAQSSEAAKLPFRDTSLSIEQRVNDLVSRMTLDEKVLQMQHTAPAISRLGIPAYDWWSEALHGVARSGYATVFPQAIGMAATWDAALIHREGETIATEARAKYNQAQRDNNHSIYFGLDFWSPNINIFRDPRWGRGQETLGEDPFLTGKLGVAFVTGLQGDDPKYFKVVATPKHYAVHSGPETLRHGFNVTPSPHDLEDTYLPAFRATVTEGHADSVMCAYNAIDGQPACANTYLLQKTLRDAWNFQGYVTSDCGAVGDITSGHHFTPDNERGSAVAVLAGTDTTCGDEYTALVKAVHGGLIKESAIDTALKRLFTARMRLGMFDPPDAVAFNQIPMSEVDSSDHRALALQAARESMVLLKNQEGFLPIKPTIRRIAVIGPNAESLQSLEGNYNGTPSRPVMPVDGMRAVFAGKADVVYAQGSPFVDELPVPVPRTVFHQAGEGSEPGLKGEYFANLDFSGTPAVTRIDPQIQFDWHSASPVPGVPFQQFAVRWSGTLTPPAPGNYSFSLEIPGCYPCDNHETFIMYLDNKLVTQGSFLDYRWQPKEPAFDVHFTDTRPHPLRVEYTHTARLFGAGISLFWQPPAVALRNEAVKIAHQADVVVAFVGLSPGLEGEEMPVHVAGFNGGDRTAIDLPRAQQDLLRALANTRKPIVVVLMNGSALAVQWARDHAAAILEAWYPGEEGGTAIAETLSGVNNPGGRLPVTFYSSLDQLPPFEDYSMANRTYRYFTGKPLFGFGYGLSYSTFDYRNLKVTPAALKAGEPLQVEVDVRNNSALAGDEVAELYIGKDASPPAARPRALKGFERIHLDAGETRHVAFPVSPRDLSVVSDESEHRIFSGAYEIFVGGAQKDGASNGLWTRFMIAGEAKLPR